MAGRRKGRDPSVPKADSGVDDEGRWIPVFAGQREPFRVGNDMRTTHGAYVAPGKLGERTHEIAACVRPYVPGYQPSHEPLVVGYGVVLTRIERAALALAQAAHPVDPTLGRLEKDLRLWLASALRYADALGLSPSSAARISRDAGIGAQAAAAHAELLAKYRGAA